MKHIGLKDKIIIIFIGFLFIFEGCSDNTLNHKDAIQMNTGHFISIFDNSVKYKCENKIIDLSNNGEFKCQSFPIAFYIDNEKLGEINSIHEDGYVFPQDIIVLEESQPVYSSYDSMSLVTTYE